MNIYLLQKIKALDKPFWNPYSNPSSKALLSLKPLNNYAIH